MICLCLLPLYPFIATVEKLQYIRLSHYVSIIKIAGIRALCMSLNLIKEPFIIYGREWAGKNEGSHDQSRRLEEGVIMKYIN